MNDPLRPFDEREPSDALPPLADLHGLEAQLSRLAPAAGRLDRDRLIFLAGQASVRTGPTSRAMRWAWPASFGVMTAIAATLLAMVLQGDGGARLPRQMMATMDDSPSEIATPGVTNRWLAPGDVKPTEVGKLWAGMPLDRLAFAGGVEQVTAREASLSEPPRPTAPLLKARSFEDVVM